MRKITFENSVNGLSATFSSDDPKSLLESFDGCSCGAEAITYRPLNYDGQRFVSSTLTARTIQFTASFGGTSNGKYSREGAIRAFEQAQRVFIPGQVGTLTWTDGVNTRFIKCRADSVPLPSEVLPFLFRADFTLTADNPLWFDSAENVQTFANIPLHTFDISNDCGFPVPFVLNAQNDPSGAFAMATAQGGLAFIADIGEPFTIDMAECTVTSASGKLCNNVLSASSTFFPLMPGNNHFSYAGSKKVEIRWRKAYLSVY